MSSADPTDLINTGQFVGLREWPGYAVSTDGHAWSCWIRGIGTKTGPIWKELSTKKRSGWRKKDGKPAYPTVTFSRNGKKTSLLLHRVILEAFVGPCPPGMMGCHFDDNPTNNHLSNLRWDTDKGNKADARRNGRTASIVHPFGSSHHNAKLKESDVPLIRSLYAQGKSQLAIAKQFGVSNTIIHRIVLGKAWCHV